MTEHLCDWCHGTPTTRIVIERAAYSGARLVRRPILAFACPAHEHHGLGEEEENEIGLADSMRRRKDRDAVQLEIFPDERRSDGGAYDT